MRKAKAKSAASAKTQPKPDVRDLLFDMEDDLLRVRHLLRALNMMARDELTIGRNEQNALATVSWEALQSWERVETAWEAASDACKQAPTEAQAA